MAGCGLLLHCMNKVGVYHISKLGFAANPPSAHVDINVVVSGGGSANFVHGSS